MAHEIRGTNFWDTLYSFDLLYLARSVNRFQGIVGYSH